MSDWKLCEHCHLPSTGGPCLKCGHKVGAEKGSCGCLMCSLGDVAAGMGFDLNDKRIQEVLKNAAAKRGSRP